MSLSTDREHVVRGWLRVALWIAIAVIICGALIELYSWAVGPERLSQQLGYPMRQAPRTSWWPVPLVVTLGFAAASLGALFGSRSAAMLAKWIALVIVV